MYDDEVTIYDTRCKNNRNCREDAAQVAIDEARKTIHGIHGIEVKDMTATVDTNTGKISQFRAGVKVSFGIEH